MQQLSVADVLSKAAVLLTPEGAWTQGNYFRSRQRNASVPRDEADCFCAVGAMTIAAGRIAYPSKIEKGDVGAALIAVLPEGATNGEDGDNGIHVWNDAPERTQAEVVAALRAAAELAKAAQS